MIFALPGINPDLRTKLIGELVSKRGYIHLDVDYVIKNAIERGTELGKKFSQCDFEEEKPICLILEQLKRILFCNPNNRKFVITNFSNEISHFKRFESEICRIEKILTFRKPVKIS